VRFSSSCFRLLLSDWDRELRLRLNSSSLTDDRKSKCFIALEEVASSKPLTLQSVQAESFWRFTHGEEKHYDQKKCAKSMHRTNIIT